MDPATLMAFANIAAQVLPGILGGGPKPEERELIPNLTPEQEALHGQLTNAAMKPGAGGAFGTSADYFRDLMSENPQALQAFMLPMMRQYNEDIVPGISEQFAGMGAGGLSSSGFRNAQVQGATDLAERLGQLRANLQMQGAQGLMNIGQMGLNPVGQFQTTQMGSPGAMQSFGQGLGNISTQMLPDSFKQIGNWLNKPSTNTSGEMTGANTSPMGGYSTGWQNIPASPGGG